MIRPSAATSPRFYMQVFTKEDWRPLSRSWRKHSELRGTAADHSPSWYSFRLGRDRESPGGKAVGNEENWPVRLMLSNGCDCDAGSSSEEATRHLRPQPAFHRLVMENGPRRLVLSGDGALGLRDEPMVGVREGERYRSVRPDGSKAGARDPEEPGRILGEEGQIIAAQATLRHRHPGRPASGETDLHEVVT